MKARQPALGRTLQAILFLQRYPIVLKQRGFAKRKLTKSITF